MRATTKGEVLYGGDAVWPRQASRRTRFKFGTAGDGLYFAGVLLSVAGILPVLDLGESEFGVAPLFKSIQGN